MRAHPRSVRVRGLVRLRERVRDQVSRGLEPYALATLREEVEAQVARFEEICRSAGLAPRLLPAPTRNAYRYLKSLDFERMPRGAQTLERPARLRGLLASYRSVLGMLASSPSELERARARIARVLAQVERACAARAIRPDALPARSAAAYQALVELQEPGGLELLVEATRRGQEVVSSLLARIRPRETRPVALRLVRTPCLWRVRETGQAIEVVLSDAFIGAPQETLEMLAQWAFGRDGGRGRARIEGWLAANGCHAVSVAGSSARARGVVYSLDELFEELNRDHFSGELARPRLSWTPAPTFHKFGHYTYTQDRVVLSASLDHPDVPRHVVAYVLYHELLHKALGMRGDGVRRQAHTAEFRTLERRFPGYEEAVAHLDSLARRWRRR